MIEGPLIAKTMGEKKRERSEVNDNSSIAVVVLKALYILSAVGPCIYALYDFFNNQNLKMLIGAYLNLVATKPTLAMFIYILGYFVSTLLCLPISIVMTISAGCLFMGPLGFCTSIFVASSVTYIAAMISAPASFFISRFLLRDFIKDLLQNSDNDSVAFYMKVLSEKEGFYLEDLKGFYVMMLFRLSPVFPFSRVNYVAGSNSSISFVSFYLSMLAFILPTLLYVTIGASVGHLMRLIFGDTNGQSDDDQITHVTTMFASAFLMLTIEALYVLHYYTKKTLDYIIARNEDEKAVQHALNLSFVMESDDEYSMRKWSNGYDA